MALRWMTLAIALALPLTAQQEPNDATGTLRRSSGLQDPNPGTPFVVPLVGGTFDMTVSGTPSTPYILAMGSYLLNGSAIAALGNQILNLNITLPVFVIGDGIGGTGLLPPFFFALDSAGNSSLAFPPGSIPAGVSLAFQAITVDPTLPLGLNLTAAAEFLTADVIQTDVIPLMTPTLPPFPAADEGIYTHTLVGGPVSFYGQSLTQITVSSNGWIRFDGQATDADLAVDTSAFLTGQVGLPTSGASPIIAALWEDLDMSVGPGLILLSEDLTTNRVTVEWINGNYFTGAAPFGTVRVVMDFSSSQPVVTLDYSAQVGGSGFTLVGISDGDIGVPPGTDDEANMIVGGNVVAFIAPSNFNSYYQDFFGASGTVPAEPEDLAGTIITFQDTTGTGQWFVF
jgi:hypothetical protein